MDFGNMIQEIIDKIKSEPSLMQQFLKQPVDTVEQLIGVDLPNEQIEQVVSQVMKKLGGAGDASEESFKEHLRDVRPSGDEVREEYEDLGLKGNEKIDDVLGKFS